VRVLALLTLLIASASFGFRLPADQLELSRPRATVYTDPLTGTPATEYVRYVEAQELPWIVLADTLNAYPLSVHPNTVAIEDLMKFGINYEVRGGTSYEWFHPTYVWDISRQLMVPVNLRGNYTGVTTPAPGTGNTSDTLAHLPPGPLTTAQCAALAAAETAHMAQAQAVLNHDSASAAALEGAVVATADAFVATSSNSAQRQLFDLVFTGAIHPSMPQSEVDALTRHLMSAHALWTMSFGCTAHSPPDIPHNQLAANYHNELHLCRALRPRDDVKLRVYDLDDPNYYVTETCAQMAN
jgi:hypothetical protein